MFLSGVILQHNQQNKSLHFLQTRTYVEALDFSMMLPIQSFTGEVYKRT